MRFLVADDHTLFREGFMSFLARRFSGVEMEIAATYQEAVNQLTDKEYDLIFLDIKMPGMDGLIGIQSLCKQAKDVPTIVVSAETNSSVIHACLKAGISGFISKSSENSTMEHAIHEVLRGGSFFPRSALIPDRLTTIFFEMSEKKQNLLKLLSLGKSNKDIAEVLFLSEGTVRQYVSDILHDFQVDNRTQAGIKVRELLRINGD